MKNVKSDEFRARFKKLPQAIQRQSTEAFHRFKENPYHPGLRFHRLRTKDPWWSASIGMHYRAVGLWEGDTIFWDFIGTHEDYNDYIKSL